MVSILPPERSSWDLLGQSIGQNLSNVLPGAVNQGYNRGQLQQGLQQIKSLASNPGSSPLDITLAAMQAGAGIPGSERYLGEIIPFLTKLAQGNAEKNIPQPGEATGQPRVREPVEPIPARPNLPQFLQKPGQENPFFPNNVGAQGGLGNVPQAATTGQKQPVLNRSQKIEAARDLQEQSNRAGLPITIKEALAEVDRAEEDKKAYNSEVDKELQQRVKGQQTYGQRAVEELRKVFPSDQPPTSEMEAIFQKMGEQASKEGDSEADINRKLAKEAKQLRNSIVNVEKDVSAPRLHTAIARGIEGTYKNLEQAGADVRKHLQPLLDLGLYDTARNLLSEKGYGLEERDAILNPLSVQAQAILNQVPKFPETKALTAPGATAFLTAPIEPIQETLGKLFQEDPNFSLPLARKSFEDKGYGWREFKDALNILEDEGVKLSDDQSIQRGNLDSPPLNLMQKLLRGLNLTGR